MRTSLFLRCLVAPALLTSVATLRSRWPPGLPTKFDINLDLPPEQRWGEVVHAYRDILPPLLSQLERRIRDNLHRVRKTTTPPPLIRNHTFTTAELDAFDDPTLERMEQDRYMEDLMEEQRKPKDPALASREKHRQQRNYVWDDWWMWHSNIEADHMAELTGIAKIAADEDVTLSRLIVWQMARESMSTYSTQVQENTNLGMVLADVNGTAIHGFNLDFDGFTFLVQGRKMSLTDILLDLTFFRGGSPIFTALSFPGRIGTGAGMTLGSPTASRWSVQWLGMYPDRSSNMTSLHRFARWGARPVELVLRRLLEAQIDFGRVGVLLQNVSCFCGFMTFMLAGSRPWEGILVHAMSPEYNVWPRAPRIHLISQLSELFHRWAIVADKTVFRLDLPIISHQLPAEFRVVMNAGQEHVSAREVLRQLRSPPAFNRGTLAAWVGTPASGYHKTYMAREVISMDGVELSGDTWRR